MMRSAAGMPPYRESFKTIRDDHAMPRKLKRKLERILKNLAMPFDAALHGFLLSRRCRSRNAKIKIAFIVQRTEVFVHWHR